MTIDMRRVRYRQQKSEAKRRGIPFLLTFDEWWEVWEPYWAHRGRRSDQLVMARHGDVGPYAVGNIKIITARENRLERRKLTPEESGSPLACADVERVRDMLACGVKQRHIASHFGVHQTTISHIKLGKKWAAACQS